MASNQPISMSVAVRDPSNTAHSLAVNADGSINVSNAATPGYSFSNISTDATTVVKSGAGVLNAVTVNTKGTVASTVTIYDNTAASGTVIATIDSLNLSGQFLFSVAFTTGLTVVTTGTVAPNITVSYR